MQYLAIISAIISASALAQSPNPDNPVCQKTRQSWSSTNPFDSKQFGNYIVNNNNWGNLPGQSTWANSASCWGVDTDATKGRGSIGGYPSVTRGWTQNGYMLDQLSSPGTSNWTTKSGLGIAVGKLQKARVPWTFSAPTKKDPTSDPPRWMALIDVYFHKSAQPPASAWPPHLDLMINPALADQAIGNSNYFALVAKRSAAKVIKIGNTRYLTYIDEDGEKSFHQPGGHNIHLFELPTQVTDGIGTIWGNQSGVTDVGAVVTFFSKPYPLDEDGQPLTSAAGQVIAKPLIATDLFLTAINAGFEIDVGKMFSTTFFCISLQSEPDCRGP